MTSDNKQQSKIISLKIIVVLHTFIIIFLYGSKRLVY